MTQKKNNTSLIVFSDDKKERMRVPLLTGMESPIIPDMGVGLTLIPQDMKSAKKAQKYYDDKRLPKMSIISI